MPSDGELRHKKIERGSVVRPAHAGKLIMRTGQGRMTRGSRDRTGKLFKAEVEAIVRAAMAVCQGRGRKTISTNDVLFVVKSKGDGIVFGADE